MYYYSIRKLLLILLTTFIAFSNLTIAKNNDLIEFDLSYYQVTDTTTNQSNILSKEFAPMPASSSLGALKGEYWFKLKLNKSICNEELIAFIPTYDIDIIKLYELDNGELKYISKTGNKVCVEELAINFKFPALQLPNNYSNVIYFQASFPKVANFPLKILPEKEFYPLIIKNQMVLSLYYGTCIIIILLSIFSFIKFSDKVFLFYALFLISISFDIIFYNGTITHFFRGYNYIEEFEILTHLAQGITLLLFSIHFLDLKERIPKLVRYSYSVPTIMTLCYLLYFYTKDTFFQEIGDAFGLIVFIGIWVLGLLYINKIAYAKYFVFAYCLALFSATYVMISYFSGAYSFSGDSILLKISGWVDMAVFIFALNYRIKNKEREYESIIEELKILISEEKTDENKIDPLFKLLQKNELSSEPLSVREIEIINAINEGLSKTQIGDKFHISVHTVKTHARNIYKKLNINNRKELKNKVSKLK